MRKKGKPRSKVYHKVNTIQFVINGVRKTPKDKLDKLRSLELSTLQTLADGTATLHDATLLLDSLNLAEVMTNSGIGEDYLGSILEAQDVLRIYVKAGMGKLGCGCFRTIREALDIHDAQRQAISLAEYEKHILKATRMINEMRREINKQLEVTQ